jgi:hypothetical protein
MGREYERKETRYMEEREKFDIIALKTGKRCDP